MFLSGYFLFEGIIKVFVSLTRTGEGCISMFFGGFRLEIGSRDC
jgi:hypothetical protein